MFLKVLIGTFVEEAVLLALKKNLIVWGLKNLIRLICAHLNINSLRNKLEMLSDIIKNNSDMLMISETKLDSSFRNGSFQIHGYSEPYRFDKNGNDGGMLVFIWEDTPTKLIESKMKIEGFFIDLNLRRKKWLQCCSYNPKYSQISHHLKDDNIILMGDFNAEPADTVVSNFCEICNLKNIIREKS